MRTRAKKGRFPWSPTSSSRPRRIPTINRQAFYVFDPQNRPLVAEADAVGEALRHATGADSGTGDIARVFRLPGTLNWATPTKIKRGRPLAPQLAVIEKEMAGYTALAMLRDKLVRTTISTACNEMNGRPPGPQGAPESSLGVPEEEAQGARSGWRPLECCLCRDHDGPA